MPASAHTDTSLAEYMHATLRATAQVLGWSVAAGNYTQPVSECLRTEGISAAGSATNVGRLEAQARRAVWQAVVNETAGDTDYTAANGTIKRKQIFESAMLMLAQADRHLMLAYGVGRVSAHSAIAASNEAVW